MKSKKELIDALMKLEGKKSQVNRAQMSEIVARLSELAKQDSSVVAIILK